MKFEVGDKFRDEQGRVITVKTVIPHDESYVVMHNGKESTVTEAYLKRLGKIKTSKVVPATKGFTRS